MLTVTTAVTDGTLVADASLMTLVYCSSATALLTEATLAELMRDCRRNNDRNGITGLLIYHDRSFLQALEGPADAVNATLERIRKDDRHNRLIVMLKTRIERRHFDRWAMAFRESADLSKQDRNAFSDFLRKARDADPHDGGPALRYLQAFRDLLQG